jgi:hypothetical protein
VWSPLLIALVIWMTVQTRRHLRSRAGRWLALPGIRCLGTSGGGRRLRDAARVDGSRCPCHAGRAD